MKKEFLNSLREHFNPRRREYLHNPEQLIGMPATEAVDFVIYKIPWIAHFTLAGHRPTLEWGWPASYEQEVYYSSGPVFWKEPFKDVFHRSVINDPNFWKEVENELREVDIRKYKGTMPVNEALKHWPPEHRSYDLAMTSKVYLWDGSVRHLPMMEFGLRPSEVRRSLIKKELSKRGEHGFLLSSDTSYHFYGLRLLKGEERDRWMNSWYWTLVDNFFIYEGYLEKRDYTPLRLTSGPKEHEIHRVIDVL